jgi:hypothetical protein
VETPSAFAANLRFVTAGTLIEIIAVEAPVRAVRVDKQ